MLNLSIIVDGAEGIFKAFRKRPSGPFLKRAFSGQFPFYVLGAGLVGAMAPRGQMLPEMAASSVDTTAGLLGYEIGATFGQALIPIPGLGGIVGAIAGMAAGAAATKIVAPLTHKISAFYNDTVHEIYSHRTVNFGGNYKDTAVAYTMRQKASVELGGSLLNARMYLGKEAVLFHQ